MNSSGNDNDIHNISGVQQEESREFLVAATLKNATNSTTTELYLDGQEEDDNTLIADAASRFSLPPSSISAVGDVSSPKLQENTNSTKLNLLKQPLIIADNGDGKRFEDFEANENQIVDGDGSQGRKEEKHSLDNSQQQKSMPSSIFDLNPARTANVLGGEPPVVELEDGLDRAISATMTTSSITSSSTITRQTGTAVATSTYSWRLNTTGTMERTAMKKVSSSLGMPGTLSVSASTSPSMLRKGSLSHGGSSSGSLPRRVSFPKSDSELVTGYLEPANPWENGKMLLNPNKWSRSCFL